MPARKLFAIAILKYILNFDMRYNLLYRFRIHT